MFLKQNNLETMSINKSLSEENTTVRIQAPGRQGLVVLSATVLPFETTCVQSVWDLWHIQAREYTAATMNKPPRHAPPWVSVNDKIQSDEPQIQNAFIYSKGVRQWSRKNKEPASVSSVILVLKLGGAIINTRFLKILFQNCINIIMMSSRLFRRKKSTHAHCCHFHPKAVGCLSPPRAVVTTTTLPRGSSLEIISTVGLGQSYGQLIRLLCPHPLFTHSQGDAGRSHLDQIVPLIQTFQVALSFPW